MPYQRGRPSPPDPAHVGEQVFNARCRPLSDPTLTPVSGVVAERVRAGMVPLLSGQAVPLIWERVAPDEVCGRYAR